MHPYSLCAVVLVCALDCLQIWRVGAYPTLVIPRLYGSVIDERYKKSDVTIPQDGDFDVFALEHLKEQHEGQTTAVGVEESETLPGLERQLEEATPSDDVASESANPDLDHGPHRPPTLPHNDGGKMTVNQPHSVDTDIGAIPSMAKPFYGAARLAFGQNPEVLPTSSTSSTSTTTSSPPQIDTNEKHLEAIASETNLPVAIPASEISDVILPIETDGHVSVREVPSPAVGDVKEAENGKQITVGEVLADVGDLQTVKTAARRSMSLMPPKMMAQYVFWTGDEAGVARAIEEFIEQGLMTREGALNFLRDIRLSIEYLQRSYKNHVLPEEELRPNNLKKSFAPTKVYTPTTSTTSTTTTTTTTEKPFPFPSNAIVAEPMGRQINENMAKTLSRISDMSAWTKMQQFNNGEQQDLPAYDDTVGRAKVAEFLYTEYTLEEILYKLAKVMFTQSLAQGSDEAQRELQKLTNFLEREGNLGVIPIDLQRSVLNVLLTALSDTLTEHPELLPAASSNLVNPYNSYGSAIMKI